MTIPIMQTGPGGAYGAKYFANGSRLLAVSGEAAGMPDGSIEGSVGSSGGADADSGGSSNAGWMESPQGRKRRQQADRVKGRPVTLLDRLLGIDRVDLSDEALAVAREAERQDSVVPAASPTPATIKNAPTAAPTMSLLAAAESWLSGQRRLLDVVVDQINRLASRARQPIPALAGASQVILPAYSNPAYPTEAYSTEVVTGIAEPAVSDVPGSAPIAAALTSRMHTFSKENRYESDAQATQNTSTDSRLPNCPRLFPDDAGARRRTRRQQGDGLRARRSADQQGSAQARAEQGSLFIHL